MMIGRHIASLLGLAGFAMARQAHVYNSCNREVYLWSVDTEHDQATPTVLKPGDAYHENYRKPAVGGVSIKLNFDPKIRDPITQFEYTDGGAMEGHIWYDVSNVNCAGSDCPFQPYGFSFHSGKGCPAVVCHAGEDNCAEVYNVWNDDHASLSCQKDQDIHLYLCDVDHGRPSGGSEPSSTTKYQPSTTVEPTKASSTKTFATSTSKTENAKPTEVQVKQAFVEVQSAPKVTDAPQPKPVVTVFETVYATQTHFV